MLPAHRRRIFSSVGNRSYIAYESMTMNATMRLPIGDRTFPLASPSTEKAAYPCNDVTPIKLLIHRNLYLYMYIHMYKYR